MKKGELVRWFDDLVDDGGTSVGGKNVSLGEMIRSLKEKGVRVLEVMKKEGLERGFQVYVMADEFAERFEGFSIGSISLNPDGVIEVVERAPRAEKNREKKRSSKAK